MRLFACSLLASMVLANAGDWPQFRGPTGQGLSEERDLPLTWNSRTGENIAWRAALPKNDSGCGVMDHSTFIATKEKEPGILRSADAGATWAKVSEEKPSAAVPVVFDGAAYWPTGKTVLVSRDKGATWAALAPVDATHGPLFKTAEHFVVVGKTGFIETKDAGQTWQPAAPLPAGFTTARVGANFAWDANADIFYASTMTKPTFKLERAK